MDADMMQAAGEQLAVAVDSLTSISDVEAGVLGLVQGLTEYLPVSSSGHLSIASHLFGNIKDGDSNLAFTIVVHIATVLSTLVVLRKTIWQLVRGLFGHHSPDFVDCGCGTAGGWWTAERRYILCIVLSMIPIMIVGLCFKDQVEAIFNGKMWIVGACLLLTALLLSFSHFSKPRERQKITFVDAVVMGIAQAVAVLPGLSRSGSTIGTGLILGVSKQRLAQFSFLMVIPPILGEAALDVLKMLKGEETFGGISTSALLIGFITAFVSGCIACKVMINLVKRGKMIWFAAYCALVGLAVLLFA